MFSYRQTLTNRCSITRSHKRKTESRYAHISSQSCIIMCVLMYLQHELVIAQDRKHIQQLDNSIDKVCI